MKSLDLKLIKIQIDLNVLSYSLETSCGKVDEATGWFCYNSYHAFSKTAHEAQESRLLGSFYWLLHYALHTSDNTLSNEKTNE